MTQTNIHHPRLFTIVFTLLWQSLVDISDAGITWWTHTLAVSSAEERLWPTQCPAPSPLSNVWLEQADTWSVGQHCSTLLHSLTDCCWQWAMFSVRRGKWCGGMRVTPWIVRSSEIVWCPGRMFENICHPCFKQFAFYSKLLPRHIYSIWQNYLDYSR